VADVRLNLGGDAGGEFCRQAVCLAISTIATRKDDLCTGLWQLNVVNLASGST
jgi:hypothetical protein